MLCFSDESALEFVP